MTAQCVNVLLLKALHVVRPQQTVEVDVRVLCGLWRLLFALSDHRSLQQTRAFQSQLKSVHPTSACTHHAKKIEAAVKYSALFCQCVECVSHRQILKPL